MAKKCICANLFSILWFNTERIRKILTNRIGKKNKKRSRFDLRESFNFPWTFRLHLIYHCIAHTMDTSDFMEKRPFYFSQYKSFLQSDNLYSSRFCNHGQWKAIKRNKCFLSMSHDFMRLTRKVIFQFHLDRFIWQKLKKEVFRRDKMSSFFLLRFYLTQDTKPSQSRE